MIQFTFDDITIVVWPWANWVRVIFHRPGLQESPDFTLPEFIKLLERVVKEKKRNG